MIDTSWRIEDPDPDEVSVGGPSTGIVSLHFLRSALRRRWPVWVAAALVGMMLGIAWTVMVPSKSQGTVTLLLAHDPGVDPATAMSTDVSLLRTRTVAQRVIDELDLPLTTEGFQASTIVTPVTPTVLVIDVAAPDSTSALARAKALSDAYLAFRRQQMDSQSTALIAGYQAQVTNLTKQADDLTSKYNALNAGGASGQGDASDLLTQRAQIYGQVSQIQQQMEDASLQAGSIDKASHVLDPPSVVPQSAKKRIVLNTMAGLIGGLALGMGLVLFQALTSGRLRRRDEVAVALAAPVRFSGGPLTGRGTRLRRLTRRSSRQRSLEVLVHGLGTAVSTPSKARPARLAVVAVDDTDAAALVTATLGAQMAVEGKAVFLVDLTDSGRLEAALKKALARQPGPGPRVEPEVLRPDSQPFLARGPLGAAPGATTELSKGDSMRPAWNRAEVVLVLAEVSPGVGVDHLTSWVDRVVLLVAAGRSSAERLRTTGELVRSAGLELDFAMMVGADRTDESSGLRDPEDPGWAGTGNGAP
ncbi:YveK family protein [Nocardioides ungokensis]